MSAGGPKQTKTEVETLAESMGLVCFIPEPHEILIDCDSGDHEPSMDLLRSFHSNGYPLMDKLLTISKGGNFHVYWRTKLRLEDRERISLQILLGSDPVRELISLRRVAEGSDAPIALFETPTQAELVRKWRSQYERSTREYLGFP